MIVINLKPRGKILHSALKLALQGQNCIVVMQKMDVSEEDVKMFQHADEEERACSICLQSISDPHELNCKHEFCKECIKSWMRAH